MVSNDQRRDENNAGQAYRYGQTNKSNKGGLSQQNNDGRTLKVKN